MDDKTGNLDFENMTEEDKKFVESVNEFVGPANTKNQWDEIVNLVLQNSDAYDAEFTNYNLLRTLKLAGVPDMDNLISNALGAIWKSEKNIEDEFETFGNISEFKMFTQERE